MLIKESICRTVSCKSCKKIGSNHSFVSEIRALTFCYTLYGVPTACAMSQQILKRTQQGNLLVVSWLWRTWWWWWHSRLDNDGDADDISMVVVVEGAVKSITSIDHFQGWGCPAQPAQARPFLHWGPAGSSDTSSVFSSHILVSLTSAHIFSQGHPKRWRQNCI